MDKYEQRRQALVALKERLGFGGIKKIAEKAGFSADYVSRMLYEPGKAHKKNIGEDSVDKISAAFPGWFFPDEDDLLRESLSQAAMAFGDKLFEPEPGYIAFGLLDVSASAGNGSQPVDFPEVVRNIHVLESWAKANLPVDLSNIKVISARGTSMQGSIENGDVLFVDSSVKSYDGDGIYVIARGNGVQVKRLQKLNGDVLAVLSDNRAYESERLVGAEADAVVVCGRVLAAWSIKRFW